MNTKVVVYGYKNKLSDISSHEISDIFQRELRTLKDNPDILELGDSFCEQMLFEKVLGELSNKYFEEKEIASYTYEDHLTLEKIKFKEKIMTHTVTYLDVEKNSFCYEFFYDNGLLSGLSDKIHMLIYESNLLKN